MLTNFVLPTVSVYIAGTLPTLEPQQPPPTPPMWPHLVALPWDLVPLLLVEARVAPEAPELTARLDSSTVVRLPPLDALPAGGAVDAGRLEGELREAADLALVPGVYRQLHRRLGELRLLVRGLHVRFDRKGVEALQQ